jgi:hypothetical protein
MENDVAHANIEKLKNLVASDATLQGELRGATSVEDFVDRLVRVGQSRGIAISREDLAAYSTAESGVRPASDAELRSVAGGRSGGGVISVTNEGNTISMGNSILCGFCGRTSATL